MYFIDFLFSCLVQLGIEKLNQMCLFLKFIISKIYKNSKLIKKIFRSLSCAFPWWNEHHWVCNSDIDIEKSVI